MVIRSISLFSGFGGLDLALAGIATPALYVEREAYAAANLVALMQAGKLDRAPIWSDVCTLDASRWRSQVRLITAGFPCQPHSAAGKRKGAQDQRFELFDHVLRIARDTGRPSLFLENVPGLLARDRGFSTVLGALAASGYDAVWTCLKAADTGASHIRKRVFILAHPRGKYLRIQPGRGGWQDWQGTPIPGHDRQAVGRVPSPSDRRGWEAWTGAQPCLLRDSNGTADRVDRLRLIGNGVCPQQARAAFAALMSITS